jgi:catechol 2,3-dioxygenase-like lactoylglutathione lyase family enzyme
VELGWFELSLDVKDVDRTRDFYEKLGFEVVDKTADGRVVTLQKADCRICHYQGYLDPAETQLIFWQGDVQAIAEDLTAKGLRFEKGPAADGRGGAGALLLDPDCRPIYFVGIPGVTREGRLESCARISEVAPVQPDTSSRRICSSVTNNSRAILGPSGVGDRCDLSGARDA